MTSNQNPTTNTATVEEEDNPMPVWIDDCHVDPAWIRQKTQLACTSCSVQDISNATRRGARVRDGATLKLTIELEDANNPMTLIMKQVPAQGLQLSQQLGLAREALFYNQLAHQVEDSNKKKMIPHVWYAFGDIATGDKVILMQDLSDTHVDSGIFFGPGNPNNWNRNLAEMTARAANPHVPTAAHVARVTFIELARVHATFWCRHDLLQPDYNWMRGHAWVQGQGKDTWEASQGLLTHYWKLYLQREADNLVKFQWDPTVRAAVEKALQGISWEAQLARLHKDGPWCVVHGDCWPGNFMWSIKNNNDDSQEEEVIQLLDWEMVGIGSGPQELGQYVLSNMDPVERRNCERDLVQAYVDELKRCGVTPTNADWDYCWKEYKLGGLERWLWFLIYFVGQEGTLDWAQFFHNQMATFMKDHDITAADIVQPRP